MGIRSDIFTALAAKLATLPWAKTVNWEKVRLMASDIAQHEVPFVQFYAPFSRHEHVTQTIESVWTISIEIVDVQSSTRTVNQKDLFDKMEDVIALIGDDPTLQIPRLVHLTLASEETDVHLIEPYYYARLDFEARLIQPYTANC
jgi:hypothetical protein